MYFYEIFLPHYQKFSADMLRPPIGVRAASELRRFGVAALSRYDVGPTWIRRCFDIRRLDARNWWNSSDVFIWSFFFRTTRYFLLIGVRAASELRRFVVAALNRCDVGPMFIRSYLPAGKPVPNELKYCWTVQHSYKILFVTVYSATVEVLITV